MLFLVNEVVYESGDHNHHYCGEKEIECDKTEDDMVEVVYRLNDALYVCHREGGLRSYIFYLILLMRFINFSICHNHTHRMATFYYIFSRFWIPLCPPKIRVF